jgi:hypothetical protein
MIGEEYSMKVVYLMLNDECEKIFSYKRERLP